MPIKPILISIICFYPLWGIFSTFRRLSSFLYLSFSRASITFPHLPVSRGSLSTKWTCLPFAQIPQLRVCRTHDVICGFINKIIRLEGESEGSITNKKNGEEGERDQRRSQAISIVCHFLLIPLLVAFCSPHFILGCCPPHITHPLPEETNWSGVLPSPGGCFPSASLPPSLPRLPLCFISITG